MTSQSYTAMPLGMRTWASDISATPLTLPEGFKGGIIYGLGLRTIYDSNFFLSEDDPESEVTLHVEPWISYVTDPEGGAPYSLTLDYHGDIRKYANNDFDGIDHSAGLVFKAVGGKTEIVSSLGYNMVSATYRYTGTFATGSVLTASLVGNYQIAPRTKVFGHLRYSSSDYDTESLAGSDIYSGEVGALWSATERITIGPSLSYSRTESDNTGTRESWTLAVQGAYSLGERMILRGFVGLERDEYSDVDDSASVGLTGGLSASYAVTPRLTWNNSLLYVTVPSPSATNYEMDNLQITSELNYQFLRATLGVGLELDLAEYAEVGDVSEQLNKEKNLTAFVKYRRKLWSERLDFDSSIHYSVNSGDSDWNQLVVAVGLRLEF